MRVVVHRETVKEIRDIEEQLMKSKGSINVQSRTAKNLMGPKAV